jgi:hypothetical protein
MEDRARRGSKGIVVEIELEKEQNSGRRETETLSWLEMSLALPRHSMLR